MEEIEVPIEKMQEEIHEHAQHDAATHSPHSSFSSRAALSSAIFAVFAAIAALMAGHHSNEAMIEQIKASDQWGYYQAKGIKSAILSLKDPSDEKTQDKIAEYKKEQEEISEVAKEKEQGSLHHLRVHEVLARAVTFFQIAITLAAIGVLTHRRKIWFMSLGFGGIGLLLFIQGLLTN